jgi:hypothetical protein
MTHCGLSFSACHSEQSEESLFPAEHGMSANIDAAIGMLRFAQHDNNFSMPMNEANQDLGPKM